MKAFPVLACCISILAAILLWRATAAGLWFTPDSRVYHDAAVSFAHSGRLWMHLPCGSRIWMNTFPPLFSVVIGLGILPGWDPLAVARVLNCLCAGLSVGLMAWILRGISASAPVGLLGALALVLLPDFLNAHRGFLSEPLFFPLMLGAVQLLLCRRPLPAAVLIGLAAAVRFAGAPFILAGALFVWLTTRNPRVTALFFAIGMLPPALVSMVNLLATGATSDRQFRFTPSGFEFLLHGLTSAAGWVKLDRLPIAVQAGIFGALLIWLVARAMRRSHRALALPLIASYVLFIWITRLFLDSGVELYPRYMVPVYALLLIAIAEAAPSPAILSAALGTLALIHLPAALAPPVNLSAGENSNHPSWRESETLRRASALPDIVCHFGSRPDLIYLRLGKATGWLPRKLQGYTQAPDPQWCESTRERLSRRRPAAFIFLGLESEQRNAQVSAAELGACLGPVEHIRLADGEIYVVR